MLGRKFQIITFYEFKQFEAGELGTIRAELLEAMNAHQIKGTVLLAVEGFNSTICGSAANVSAFVQCAQAILRTEIEYKSSYYDQPPFRKAEVKIRPEIVTLKRDVDVSLGRGTHVSASKWNEVISDPEVLVLDTRNDYEFKNGTFKNAVNPGTEKFSELPEFVDRKLDPKTHKKIAMFCTGGIRCEKFAPYMKSLGFENVYQLEGGILKYLESVPSEEQLWDGECFVFDDRITVDGSLQKGTGPDHSIEKASSR